MPVRKSIFPAILAWFLLIYIAQPVTAAPGRILDRMEVEQANTTAFAAEAEIFKSIGHSIALSIAQCQGQTECESVVDKAELHFLIENMDDRINRLVIKQQNGEEEYADVITAYVNQREQYQAYQRELEALLPSPEISPETEQLSITTEEPVEEKPVVEEVIDLSIFEDVDEDL